MGVTMAALLGVASMAGGVSPARAATKCVPGPGADLSHCNFTNKNLAGKNLRAANFTSAILTGANLTGANLTGAIMTNSTITRTKLAGATLTSVQSGGVKGTPASLPNGMAPRARATSSVPART